MLELRDTHIAIGESEDGIKYHDVIIDFLRDEGDKIRVELTNRKDGLETEIGSMAELKAAFHWNISRAPAKNEVTIKVLDDPLIPFGGNPILTVQLESSNLILIFDDFEFTMNGELL